MPIKPKVWISANYEKNPAQNKVIKNVISILEKRNHIVHQVSGLEPIVYDDVNTLPNYQNSVIINEIALVPSFNRAEDIEIQNIFKSYGFLVYAIDCSKIVESNALLHCISRMQY